VLFSLTPYRAALIELAGPIQRVFSVVKVRGGAQQDIRLFDITGEGIVIGETLSAYDGIMSGHPMVSQ